MIACRIGYTEDVRYHDINDNILCPITHDEKKSIQQGAPEAFFFTMKTRRDEIDALLGAKYRYIGAGSA